MFIRKIGFAHLGFFVLLLVFAGIVQADTSTKTQGETIWLDQLDLSKVQQYYKTAQPGKNVGGNPLKLGGKVYEHGVGTHARSEILIDLGGEAASFSSLVGVDDQALTKGSICFEVYLDGKLKAKSGVMKGQDQPQSLEVDLQGGRYLSLIVTTNNDRGNCDWADWADAKIVMIPGATQTPKTTWLSDDLPAISYEKDGPEPAIHGPHVVGANIHVPFLFKIPATGQPPLRFKAEGLPAGLTLDKKTGLVTGELIEAGTTPFILNVKNKLGETHRKLTIVAGPRCLALTPPLGWNSWNIWAGYITADKVRQAAQGFQDSGLINKGYQYLNIDDGWQGERDENGILQPHEGFGDVKQLADDLHGMGLKLGIYSSPGPMTCAYKKGSYEHELLDAQTWADWGVDYLKYDFCYYGKVIEDINDPVQIQEPYLVMRDALDSCGRDIVYSFCEYGMGEVWKWGKETGGNLWRTTGDITDSWASMSMLGFLQNGLEEYSGPGHWNDPDMLVVGKVGWGREVRPTRLTRDEQVTHVTLWSLLSAPLLLGCDLTLLNEFEIAMLGNSEVIDVNQDPLGQQARRVCSLDSIQSEIWARPLYDGTLAVGCFNRGMVPTSIEVNWKDLGIKGEQNVRDLWMRQDVGIREDGFTCNVAAHGCRLFKIGTPLPEEECLY